MNHHRNTTNMRTTYSRIGLALIAAAMCSLASACPPPVDGIQLCSTDEATTAQAEAPQPVKLVLVTELPSSQAARAGTTLVFKEQFGKCIYGGELVADESSGKVKWSILVNRRVCEPPSTAVNMRIDLPSMWPATFGSAVVFEAFPVTARPSGAASSA